MEKTLIVNAFGPEMSPFEDWASSRPHIALGLCGVGMLEAVVQTTQLIEAHRPSHVFFTGSIGSFRSAQSLLSMCSVERVVLGDLNLVLGEAELPEVCSRSFHADSRYLPSISQLSCQAEKISVYSPLGITRSSELAKNYSSLFTGYGENLELFGVAYACAQKKVPWNAISCVTNHISSSSHEEWKSNVLRAATLTAQAIIELLE